jgi:hypothetical protein
VVKEVAARVKTQKGLDPDVMKCVVDALLTNDDPIASVDALDSQLYAIAVRRAGKKK